MAAVAEKVLVTGASSGIGAELAWMLAALDRVALRLAAALVWRSVR